MTDLSLKNLIRFILVEMTFQIEIFIVEMNFQIEIFMHLMKRHYIHNLKKKISFQMMHHLFKFPELEIKPGSSIRDMEAESHN